jgi:hypothetical protein
MSRVESYVTTDGHSASLSWNKAPIWDLRPNFYYCQTTAGLLMWGALSDQRMGLSFTIAAGPRQFSHSQVRVPIYCLRFETSLFVASYESQGEGGGIPSRLNTGWMNVSSASIAYNARFCCLCVFRVIKCVYLSVLSSNLKNYWTASSNEEKVRQVCVKLDNLDHILFL